MQSLSIILVLSLTCIASATNCFNGGSLITSNETETITEYCECLPMFKGDNCSELRKSQFIAFSLSFAFTNFGAMNFYLGFLSIAIAQVICGVIACTLSCIWSVAKNQGETSLSQLHKHAAMSCLSCITCMFGLLMLIWWFVDWCRVLDRAITDSNGHELFYDLY